MPQVLLVLLYEPCSTTRDESCNDVNDEPCADPAPSQNDLFAPVFEAAAAELGDEIPLARINGNLVPRAIQQYPQAGSDDGRARQRQRPSAPPLP